ncbi:MAG TPA: tetratricopeptide repeat protein, partial [Saprospiraceae bacterium]|nr:tetratricopeptide repeat protein [Saprospiraceae bacterium]
QLQSNSRQSKKDIIRSYTLLGDNYMALKQYDLAVSSYQTAIQKGKSSDLQLKLATALFKTNNYKESTSIFEQLLDDDLSNWQRIQVLEGLGNVTLSQQQTDLAISYYKKAVRIATTHKITPKISELNTKIAGLLTTEGKDKEASLYIQNTLKSAKSEHLKKRANVQNNVADIYQQNNDYDNEIQLRKQTLKELEEAQVDRVDLLTNEVSATRNITTPQLNLEIGKAYLNKKEFNKAIPYLEKSASKAKELKELQTQKDAVQQLSELYKKIGNSKKALQKYQEYAKLVDKVYQQKEKEIEDIIALNNNLREKQNRINSLEKDRELSKSRIQ